MDGIVNDDGVRIRSGPGLNYSIKTTANTGEVFQVISSSSGWIQVKLNDSTSGWVAEYLLDISQKSIVVSTNLQVYKEASTRTAVIGSINKNEPVIVKKKINGWNLISSSKVNGWVYDGLLSSEAIVSANSLNIYQDASLRTNVIGTLTKGQTLEITREINGWYYITYSGKVGWIYYSHLTNGSPKQAVSKPSTSPTISSTPAIVLAAKVNVHQKESTRTPIIGSVVKNESVTILREINGWYQIKSSKLTGWIYGNLLKTNFQTKASNINLYSDATLRSLVIGSFPAQQNGTIIKEINGWYYVTLNGNLGWIYYKHLTDGSPLGVSKIEYDALVTPSVVNVYKDASTRTQIIGNLKKDTYVQVKKEVNGWFYIESEKVNGWVYGSLLNTKFVVKAKSVNVYKDASTRSSTINKLSSGNEGIIVKEINGWYYITSGSINGWVYYKHLTEGSPEATIVQDEFKEYEAITLVNGLNIYKEASLRMPVVKTIQKDQVVIVKKEINGWYLIQSNETVGWVYRDILKRSIVTKVNNIDVYLSATTRTTILDKLNSGTTIVINKEINGWYQIQYGKKEGWVYKDHLQKGSPILKKLNGYILRQTYAYFEPTSSSVVKGSLISGNRIYVTREVNGFLEVETPNFKGWVPANDVKIVTKYSSLIDKTIVLDAGHGGKDPGAVGKTYTTYEKVVTLQTVAKLHSKLTAYGANVILTRANDVFLSLPERVQVSNNNQTDVFISVHFNSAESRVASGIETLYYHKKDLSLASNVQESIIAYTKRTNRGTKYQDVHVLRENSKPAILLELGFLSNSDEEALIRTDKFQDLLATGIVEGVVRYFDSIQ